MGCDDSVKGVEERAVRGRADETRTRRESSRRLIAYRVTSAGRGSRMSGECSGQVSLLRRFIN